MAENQHKIDFLNYLDGRTSTDDNTRIEAHLRSCPACSKTLANLKEVYGLIDHRPILEPNLFLGAKLEDRLYNDSTQRIFSEAIFDALKPVAIVAAIIFGVYLGTPATGQMDSGDEIAAFEEELFIQDYEDVLLSFNIE